MYIFVNKILNKLNLLFICLMDFKICLSKLKIKNCGFIFVCGRGKVRGVN